MRKCILTLCLALLSLAPASARIVSDSAGRKVELPAAVGKVFAAGPPASILLYMLAPDRMTGWPDPPRNAERPYIASTYRDLPALGRLTGRGGTANLESVLKVKPDLILDFGSIRATYVSLADNIQAQTGVPYLLIDGRFEVTPAALRLLGRARALAQETRIIVMDEPTASLDFGNQIVVLTEIRRLAARGLAIVLSTHDPDHAFAVATGVALMKDGRLIAEGTPSDVLTPDRLRDVYGVTVAIERSSNGSHFCVPSFAS